MQGIGGGAILNLSDIITSDIVPLAERGLYQGLIGAVWALASGVGPPIVCKNIRITVPLYGLTPSRQERSQGVQAGGGYFVGNTTAI